MPRAPAAARPTVPLLTLAITAVVAIGGELLCRAPSVRARLRVPTLGSTNRRLDLQLAGLAAWSRAHGAVNCIALGDSLVLAGIVPTALGEAYTRAADVPVRCYTMGVPGITARGSGALAGALAADHDLALVVFGLNPLDFMQLAHPPPPDPIADIPWLRYRRGEPSVRGWLVEHSRAYRYALFYRYWVDPRRWLVLAQQDEFRTIGGFLPSTHVWKPPRDVAARAGEAPTLRHATLDLEGLDALAALSRRGVRVALVEMPVTRHSATGMRDPHVIRLWERLRAEIADIARRNDLPFVRNVPPDLLPPDAWRDAGHLNNGGAIAFSTWLGTELGRAVRATR